MSARRSPARSPGRLTSKPVDLAKGAETTLDVRIPLDDCRLWSPEDPFLYTLEADSGADSVRTRFGMREFKFDPATGRAMLNGKPYFMRGSNITLYRFFEDSECGKLPWDEKWVRLLHQRVKDMHWNCLRYCIGFPPEAWYDIADEAGILIDDEFPIWFGGDVPKEMQTEELAKEYAEWMRERWNHPCVAIWDACNETLSPKTGAAFKQVRALDLSNRPWDNGYSRPQEPGDMFEAHPYHFFGSFRLRNLATANPQPGDGKHAVVINEYGWHWVNRDGTPTTLTSELYRNVLGAECDAGAAVPHAGHVAGRGHGILARASQGRRRDALHHAGLQSARRADLRPLDERRRRQAPMGTGVLPLRPRRLRPGGLDGGLLERPAGPRAPKPACR